MTFYFFKSFSTTKIIYPVILDITISVTGVYRICEVFIFKVVAVAGQVGKNSFIIIRVAPVTSRVVSDQTVTYVIQCF